MHMSKIGHNCQIDCTNHDEVINKLEIKSKDLYYFWRNYEWLYNRYYSHKNEDNSLQQRFRELEKQLHQLEIDNKKLRIENQSLRKSQHKEQPNTMKNDYEKQIQRYRIQIRQYEGIRDKLTAEINNLTRKIKNLQHQLEDNQSRYRRQSQKQQSIIIELQQDLDDLRSKMLNQKPNNSDVAALQQKYTRQIQKMRVMMSSLESQCISIIEQQFQSSKSELLQNFPRMFQEFSRGDLSNIIIVEEEN